MTSFAGVFTKLDSPEQNITLGDDIKEFMNVFRLVHGDEGVIAHGNITPSIKKIYDAVLEQNVLTNEGGATTVDVEEFTGPIPIMPEICFVKADNLDMVVHIEFEDFQLDKTTLKCQVKKTEALIRTPKSQYIDVVKNEMMKFTRENVFSLFTTPIKALDDVNKSNSTSFSDVMKNTDMYRTGKSFFDLLMNFSQRDSIGLETPGQLPEAPADEDDSEDKKKAAQLYADVKDLHDILRMSSENTTDHMNSLVIDIMKTQTNIEDTKKRVKEQRNKLYTYVARDSDYTRNLRAERNALKIVFVILAIVVVANSILIYTNRLTKNTKTTAIVALSSVVIFAHLLNKIISAFTGKKRTVIEGFEVELNSMGFTDTTYDCPTVLANFIDKFGEVLSQEIKQEYFDTLHESQAKDLKILSQLEKEHNINSHFHHLKNNLTHFKINETREYRRLSWYSIVLTSLLAMLYSAKINFAISNATFKISTTLMVVTFVTYVLLTVKGIMMRDRQDWDRFHWTINKLNNKVDSSSCNALPGFQR
tara:strand:- start:586 stop:2184 length:1599 start_codon:yes stop_codon:yes gene_type:complete